MALDYESNQVYTPEFDPTSLFAGDFPKRTRKITLASGQNSSGSPLAMGTLLGEVTNRGSWSAATPAAKAGNTGNGTCVLGSPATLSGAQSGVYRVVFSSATAFTVYDPQGEIVGTGVNGTAFATQIKFTTTAGGTAFVSTDEFDITVSQAQETPYSVASVAGGSNTGNGTNALASPAYLANAQVGAYTVEMTAATTFQVTDPYGNPVGTGSTGVAFATQIGFTLSASALALRVIGGSRRASRVVLSALLVAALLEAALGICLACRMYPFLVRAGIVSPTSCPECADVGPHLRRGHTHSVARTGADDTATRATQAVSDA